jgi:hypothetical protein
LRYLVRRHDISGARRAEQLYAAQSGLEGFAMHHYNAADEVSLSTFWKDMLTIVSYTDRIDASNARLAGMPEDLHMSDVE